ncbi:FAS1 domain-containing protein [Cristinia sonorae]|uniref:FAS1 domain-containing protein n=1 Tax=Cristinia sonorae TaxID=1940300 RepID=A0A8K0XQV1_9AGAR|nr:FAS1 domain-containing protein [Cristinia sonorae]
MLTSSLLLAAAVPAAMAQNITFLTGLLGSLQSAGLTQIASIAQSLNSTSEGQNVLASLSSGSPYLLLAPNDAALENAPANVTSDANALASVFSYHVVPGSFNGTAPKYPNTTLARTLLVNGNYVQLEGNKPQVVAWSTRADGKVHILNQRNDSTVVNTTSFGNLTVWVVDHLLQIPQDLSTTIPADKISLTGVDAVLKTIQTPFFDSTTNASTNVTLFDALNTGFHGFTFFAPNTSAISLVQSQLQQLNTTAAQTVLYNHLLNGTTVYTPELPGESFVTAAGETLSFTLNTTGTFVTDQTTNITARIVQPDVLLPNGVIHVIDRVLFNTNSDASAASSAIASATSAATQTQSSQTAPIGFSQTSGLASPTGGSDTGSAVSAFGGASWGILVAALGVVFGGLITVA